MESIRAAIGYRHPHYFSTVANQAVANFRKANMNSAPISTCTSPSTLAAVQPGLSSASRQNSQNLWQRLGATTYACEREPIVNGGEIGNHVAGVICPQRTAVQVNIMTGTSPVDAYIHANRIPFPQPRNPASAMLKSSR